MKNKQAIAEAWKRGLLSWKLHAAQKKMYNIYSGAEPSSTLVWLCSRQLGKSALITILALEQALKKPNSVIKILTDTKLHARNIFDPLFKQFTEDCPEELKPQYHRSDYQYTFANGSVIQLAGSDGGHFEKLRGQKSELILVDEAGFVSNLEEVVMSVLRPTTTHTGGKIILASTPPSDPDHDFHHFIETAEANGTLSKFTLYDNPLLSQEQIEKIIFEYGGVNSDRFRREYLVEIIRSDKNLAFPEFDDNLCKEIVKEWKRPPFFDCYVGMDLGGKDLTAVIFGYYDFRNDRIVIEDELIMDFAKPQNTVQKLTNDIKKKEEGLWFDPLTNEQRTPLSRVSDVNPIVLKEINIASKGQLFFKVARKDEKEAAVNNLRVLLENRKIVIDPRCTTLIRHLKNAKWSENRRKEFARSVENGHYDAVDALIYMVRSMMFSKNPYPAHYDLNLRQEDTFYRNPYSKTDSMEAYRAIFGLKRKR